MHDDQHGTAIVVLAGLINACKVTGRNMADLKIVIVGAGAAGVAIAKLLKEYADPRLLAVDSKGVISSDRTDLNESKQRLLEFTNLANVSGQLTDVLAGADVFIGVSGPGILTADMVKTMAKDPIIFALSNPTPEIMPDVAREAGAAVVATGRSDFPNQINNALAFPGIFRGALDNRVRDITDKHKMQTAEAIAAMVEDPSADCIIPPINQPGLVDAISRIIV
jgi:malate dehydrogenase (oxaloacetate-decarboxylating)